MGKRTRKPRNSPPPAHGSPVPATRGADVGVPGSPDGPPVAEDKNASLKRGYARSEARNEAIRQSLEPLKPGERPGAVTIAAVLALVLGFVNIGLLAAGVTLSDSDDRPPVVDTLAFAGVMWIAAFYLWKARYWAVLGFQAVLGITIVIAGLSLPLASNLTAVAICVTVLLLGGWLFWKLVRALARLQMPGR